MTTLTFRKENEVKLGYAPRIVEEIWERHKETIVLLHHARKSREEIRYLLRDRYAFQPSLGQLNSQIRKWGLNVCHARGTHHQISPSSQAIDAQTFRVSDSHMVASEARCGDFNAADAADEVMSEPDEVVDIDESDSQEMEMSDIVSELPARSLISDLRSDTSSLREFKGVANRLKFNGSVPVSARSKGIAISIASREIWDFSRVTGRPDDRSDDRYLSEKKGKDAAILFPRHSGYDSKPPDFPSKFDENGSFAKLKVLSSELYDVWLPLYNMLITFPTSDPKKRGLRCKLLKGKIEVEIRFKLDDLDTGDDVDAEMLRTILIAEASEAMNACDEND